MSHENHLRNERLSACSAKITLSMDELAASLDSFLVETAEADMRGQVFAAEITEAVDCTWGGFTCNIKCGETGYWQCGPTSVEHTCV